MFTVESFTLGPLAQNCYVLVDEASDRAIVIDPGIDPEPLIKRIEPLQIEAVLLTHAHFDHIGGLERVREWKKCPVYIHQQEADWLTDPVLNGSSRWPDVTGPISGRPADHLIREEGTMEWLGQTFHVLHTPGHSPGSVSYLCGQHLFSGDVLFQDGVGRTDLPGGSSRELFQSIATKLMPLPDETIVYPGHGPHTTIGAEKKSNPYLIS